MPTPYLVAVYGCSAALALLLLFLFRARSWYWHGASVVAALVIGLIPIPAAYHSPRTDVAVGGVFLFLLLWGICAPAFPDHHHPRGGHAKHA